MVVFIFSFYFSLTKMHRISRASVVTNSVYYYFLKGKVLSMQFVHIINSGASSAGTESIEMMKLTED